MTFNTQKFLAGTIALVLVMGTTAPAFAEQTSIATAGNVASLVDIAAGECGEVDLTFAIDTTGSMGGAIDNVVANLPAIIAQADVADVNTARLGLIIFNGAIGLDFAEVRHDLATDRATVEASLAALTACSTTTGAMLSSPAIRASILVFQVPRQISIGSGTFPDSGVRAWSRRSQRLGRSDAA